MFILHCFNGETVTMVYRISQHGILDEAALTDSSSSGSALELWMEKWVSEPFQFRILGHTQETSSSSAPCCHRPELNSNTLTLTCVLHGVHWPLPSRLEPYLGQAEVRGRVLRRDELLDWKLLNLGVDLHQLVLLRGLWRVTPAARQPRPGARVPLQDSYCQNKPHSLHRIEYKTFIDPTVRKFA